MKSVFRATYSFLQMQNLERCRVYLEPHTQSYRCRTQSDVECIQSHILILTDVEPRAMQSVFRATYSVLPMQNLERCRVYLEPHTQSYRCRTQSDVECIQSHILILTDVEPRAMQSVFRATYSVLPMQNLERCRVYLEPHTHTYICRTQSDVECIQSHILILTYVEPRAMQSVFRATYSYLHMQNLERCRVYLEPHTHSYRCRTQSDVERIQSHILILTDVEPRAMQSVFRATYSFLPMQNLERCRVYLEPHTHSYRCRTQSDVECIQSHILILTDVEPRAMQSVFRATYSFLPMQNLERCRVYLEPHTHSYRCRTQSDVECIQSHILILTDVEPRAMQSVFRATYSFLPMQNLERCRVYLEPHTHSYRCRTQSDVECIQSHILILTDVEPRAMQSVFRATYSFLPMQNLERCRVYLEPHTQSYRCRTQSDVECIQSHILNLTDVEPRAMQSVFRATYSILPMQNLERCRVYLEPHTHTYRCRTQSDVECIQSHILNLTDVEPRAMQSVFRATYSVLQMQNLERCRVYLEPHTHSYRCRTQSDVECIQSHILILTDVEPRAMQSVFRATYSYLQMQNLERCRVYLEPHTQSYRCRTQSDVECIQSHILILTDVEPRAMQSVFRATYSYLPMQNLERCRVYLEPHTHTYRCRTQSDVECIQSHILILTDVEPRAMQSVFRATYSYLPMQNLERCRVYLEPHTHTYRCRTQSDVECIQSHILILTDVEPRAMQSVFRATYSYLPMQNLERCRVYLEPHTHTYRCRTQSDVECIQSHILILTDVEPRAMQSVFRATYSYLPMQNLERCRVYLEPHTHTYRCRTQSDVECIQSHILILTDVEPRAMQSVFRATYSFLPMQNLERCRVYLEPHTQSYRCRTQSDVECIQSHILNLTDVEPRAMQSVFRATYSILPMQNLERCRVYLEPHTQSYRCRTQSDVECIQSHILILTDVEPRAMQSVFRATYSVLQMQNLERCRVYLEPHTQSYRCRTQSDVECIQSHILILTDVEPRAMQSVFRATYSYLPMQNLERCRVYLEPHTHTYRCRTQSDVECIQSHILSLTDVEPRAMQSVFRATYSFLPMQNLERCRVYLEPHTHTYRCRTQSDVECIQSHILILTDVEPRAMQSVFRATYSYLPMQNLERCRVYLEPHTHTYRCRTQSDVESIQSHILILTDVEPRAMQSVFRATYSYLPMQNLERCRVYLEPHTHTYRCRTQSDVECIQSHILILTDVEPRAMQSVFRATYSYLPMQNLERCRVYLEPHTHTYRCRTQSDVECIQSHILILTDVEPRAMQSVFRATYSYLQMQNLERCRVYLEPHTHTYRCRTQSDVECIQSHILSLTDVEPRAMQSI